MLGDGCPGVGPVNGTLKGQDLQLYINEFGQDISLTGTFNPIAEGGTAASGQFSKLIGGCSFQSTGNWSAVQIPVVTGAFKGAITSSFIPTSNVTGSISQGANIGSSSSTITATINLDSSSSQTFCPIPSQMSMTGVISGTSLSLFFYDQLGNPLATAPQIGTVTPDGRTVTTTVPLTAPSSTGTCIATPASLTMTLS